MRRAIFVAGAVVFLVALMISIGLVFGFCLVDKLDAADTIWKIVWAELVGLLGCGIGASVGEKED